MDPQDPRYPVFRGQNNLPPRPVFQPANGAAAPGGGAAPAGQPANNAQRPLAPGYGTPFNIHNQGILENGPEAQYQHRLAPSQPRFPGGGQAGPSANASVQNQLQNSFQNAPHHQIANAQYPQYNLNPQYLPPQNAVQRPHWPQHVQPPLDPVPFRPYPAGRIAMPRRDPYAQPRQQALNHPQQAQQPQNSRPPQNTQQPTHAVQPQQTQPVQPAQPAAPPSTLPADIAEWNRLKAAGGNDFGDHIRTFGDLERFEEAEKRADQVPTHHLANDFPTGQAQLTALSRRMFNALKYLSLNPQAGGQFSGVDSPQTMGRVKSRLSIELEMLGMQLVRATREAQRGEVLLPASPECELARYSSFTARFAAVENSLRISPNDQDQGRKTKLTLNHFFKASLFLVKSATESIDWVNRIAANPAKEQKSKEQNDELNKKKKFQLAQWKADHAAPGGSSGRGKRSKRAKRTHEQVEEVAQEDDAQAQPQADQATDDTEGQADEAIEVNQQAQDQIQIQPAANQANDQGQIQVPGEHGDGDQQEQGQEQGQVQNQNQPLNLDPSLVNDFDGSQAPVAQANNPQQPSQMPLDNLQAAEYLDQLRMDDEGSDPSLAPLPQDQFRSLIDQPPAIDWDLINSAPQLADYHGPSQAHGQQPGDYGMNALLGNQDGTVDPANLILDPALGREHQEMDEYRLYLGQNYYDPAPADQPPPGAEGGSDAADNGQ
ncbi:hypothetical protein Daus18300_011221 [Diaporthe australafricana]|uniref:Uncharacterized protein n=1 Tax=Diaporthe australafricana TaxID=127596 RepID=A0ABR3W7G7_9PEZI